MKILFKFQCLKWSQEQMKLLRSTLIDTPIGSMLAIADDAFLYLLEFVDRRGLQREVEQLRSDIIPGSTRPLRSIRKELDQYFRGKNLDFQTPFKMLGSFFQKLVWKELLKIPVGETRSYAEIARRLSKPKAFRAVARANGANQFAIIIPCHRVINSSGGLGGYSSGLARKQWLLNHEKMLGIKKIIS